MRSFFMILMLFSSPLFASVFCTMNPVLSIACEFSLEHHNRIFIEDGRIKKILFPEDQLIVRLEETSGQAFVQAKPNHRSTVLISVISSDGIVQDIEITFNQVPSQVVVLKHPSSSDIKSKSTVTSFDFHPYSPQAVVMQILKGESPQGFQSITSRESVWNICRGVKATLLGTLEGCEETLYLYQVNNSGFLKKCISEALFKSICPSWVYIQNRKLPSKQKTLAIVAVPR